MPGEDLVDEGKTGHLVPIRSPGKIAQAIHEMIVNRNLKKEIRILCQKKATQYTWANYAQKIIDFNLSRHLQRLKLLNS